MYKIIGVLAFLLSIGSAHAVDCDSTNSCRPIGSSQVAFLYDPSTDQSLNTIKYFSDHRTTATKVVLPYSSKDMLVIVNRSFFAKSFDYTCESKLLNTKVNVFVDATITNNDAAMYLYSFGTRGHAPNAPATMYARSLDDVMSDFGQSKLHSLACEAVSKVSHKGTPTIDVQKATAFFAGFGITVNSMWMTKAND